MPREIVVNKIRINEEKRIANKGNNFFIDLGSELIKEFTGPARSIESYIPKSSWTKNPKSSEPIKFN